jgi:hypothetical protein
MKRNTLSRDACRRYAELFQLPDLCAHANALHAKAEALTGKWTPMVILRAFLFFRPKGEDGICAVLFAFAGTGAYETEGYEGVQVRYAPDEYPAALAELAKAAAAYGEEFIAKDLTDRMRNDGLQDDE